MEKKREPADFEDVFLDICEKCKGESVDMNSLYTSFRWSWAWLSGTHRLPYMSFDLFRHLCRKRRMLYLADFHKKRLYGYRLRRNSGIHKAFMVFLVDRCVLNPDWGEKSDILYLRFSNWLRKNNMGFEICVYELFYDLLDLSELSVCGNLILGIKYLPADLRHKASN